MLDPSARARTSQACRVAPDDSRNRAVSTRPSEIDDGPGIGPGRRWTGPVWAWGRCRCAWGRCRCATAAAAIAQPSAPAPTVKAASRASRGPGARRGRITAPPAPGERQPPSLLPRRPDIPRRSYAAAPAAVRNQGPPRAAADRAGRGSQRRAQGSRRRDAERAPGRQALAGFRCRKDWSTAEQWRPGV
jgi:hypothetical protein